MPSRLTEVIVDCHDIEALVEFWCAVLGYEPAHRSEGWVAIGPIGRELSEDDWRAAPRAPFVTFVRVPERRTGKNRVHLDVTPIETTRNQEVERLVGLGASRADIGQGDTPWTVLADPEGNEFCVMPGIGEDRPGPN
jgi:catechol 2,3-dioxygenase-like lactoylglutathione lyase family enzyme